MKFCPKKAILACIILFSPLSFSQPTAPDKCPSVAQIQAEGLTVAEMIDTDQWFLAHDSQYDTSVTWEFILFVVNGNTEDEAFLNGSKILRKLSGNPTPESHAGIWGCDYDLGDDYLAIATVK